MFFAAEPSIINVNTAIIVAIALIVGIYTLINGRASVWKSNYEGEKERADNLDASLKLAQQRIKDLESQPNVDALVKLMIKHDNRAESRNKAIITVLDNMAKKVA